MRMIFDASAAALSNHAGARVREATRFAMMAQAASLDGHDVAFVPNAEFVRSGRATLMPGLPPAKAGWPADVLVISAESITERYKRRIPAGSWALVGVKTTEDVRYDRSLLRSLDVLVCEEHAPDWDVATDPNLLPVPYFVNDCVVELLVRSGFWKAFVAGDLTAVRKGLSEGPVTAEAVDDTKSVKFIGCEMYGRREAVTGLFDRARELGVSCRAIFTGRGDRPDMNVETYLRSLWCSLAGVHIAGNTPKANRFSELVMMGVPVVTVACPLLDSPAIDDTNAIMLRDWNDAEKLAECLRDSAVLVRRVVNAERCYHDGWGPRGVVRQIISRLNKSPG